MNILEKIEKMQAEPEHVRIRYVWISVAISMVFIVAIWIFSIGSLFQEDEKNAEQQASSTASISEQLENLKQQAPSMKDFSEKTNSIKEEVMAETKNQTDFQYSAEGVASNGPQADAYSELSQQPSQTQQ